MDGWTNYWTRTSYPGTTIQILLELFKTREEKKAENQRREAAQAVKRTLKKSIADMESTIATLEKKQARLALDLEHPSTYANPNKAMALNRELMGVQASITTTTAAWEKALEDLAGIETRPEA